MNDRSESVVGHDVGVRQCLVSDRGRLVVRQPALDCLALVRVAEGVDDRVAHDLVRDRAEAIVQPMVGRLQGISKFLIDALTPAPLRPKLRDRPANTIASATALD